jgi:two-component system, LuxR family, response regulator FixJ
MGLGDAVVHVVDDDDAIRHAILFQLETAGFQARDYPSAEAFLEVAATLTSGCLLTDIRMPGLSGMGLVQELSAMKFALPIIMMTGHADVPLAVEAMKAGVADFLEKPLNDEQLLRAVSGALRRAERSSDEAEAIQSLRLRFASLSPRERDVLAGVVAGKANKVIAIDLGISPRTVEVYRAGLMAKSGASSLSELVRMAMLLGL